MTISVISCPPMLPTVQTPLSGMHVYEVGGAMVLEPQGVRTRTVVLPVTGHSFSIVRRIVWHLFALHHPAEDPSDSNV